MPAISVIMPVYNAAAYLQESIESILTQTFEDFEFIIINDGSTDGSENIIRSYDDPRIKYIRNESNRKLIYCLNLGLEVASGSYIARLDSDDIAIPERFQLQYDFMEANPDVLICGGGFEKFGSIQKMDSFGNTFLLSLLTAQFQHSTVFLRTHYFKSKNLYYDRSAIHFEDYKLWADIYVAKEYQSRFFYNLPQVLIKYRVHPDQVTHTNQEDQLLSMAKVRRKYLIDFFNDHQISFRFTGEELHENDIYNLENIFSTFSSNKTLLQKFSPEELLRFKALAIYWLYISYPNKSLLLLCRFILKHIGNTGITHEEKLKVFMHLTFGKEYKRRF